MPSDYEAITRDNIHRRGVEFDDIGNLLAEKLYGDRAHFIYELLQNAEDALALRYQKDPGVSGDVTFRLCSGPPSPDISSERLIKAAFSAISVV